MRQGGKLTSKQIADQAKTFAERSKTGMGSKLDSVFSAIEKPFRDPVTGDISKFRTGLGA